MAVLLTERAAHEIQRVLTESNKPDGTILRVGVAAGGCSGFQYDFRFDEDGGNTEQDQISEHHGVKVAVDKKSGLFLDGTTIDFYEGLERRGFTFDNPNVVKSCGCGSSFSA